jgi:type VI secretion system protein ImpF
MSKPQNSTRIVPSVLDRLLDDNPQRTGKLPIDGAYRNVKQLRAAVAQKLAALISFNQAESGKLRQELGDLNPYLVAYGVTDIGSMGPHDPKNRADLIRVLKEALTELDRTLSEPLTAQFQTVRQLRAVVARDLEAMLNTRQEFLAELPPGFSEVENSLLTYGLPDLTFFSLDSLEDRNQVRRAVEQTIAIFEPRLEQVRVSLQPAREKDRGLNFRIDAMLRVDPAPEPVTFDAVLQLNTQQYVVRGQS